MRFTLNSLTSSKYALTFIGVILALALLLVFASNPGPAAAQTHASDRAALVALYNATNGDNWTDNTNWMSNTPLDYWNGVETNSDGRVIGLWLDSNQLTGAIPPELANLSNLEGLSLSYNELTGTIPPELGSLTSLEQLSLDGNQLTGAIPPELANLSNLEWLGLSNNQLTGAIPPELANLSSLRRLYLYYNQLTGAIPPELASLSNLESLVLDSNQLTGAIPPELASLSNLESLGLDSNQLTGTIPSELGNLSNLGYLGLDSNQLTGTIPSELGNLSNLGYLGLDSNQLTGTIPSELGNLSNLESLRLDENQLTGAIPPELGSLSNLESLRLDSNQLTGAIPPEIASLSNLESLGLAGNQLTGAIPPEIASLSNLESLGLAGNQLTGAIPPEIGNLSNLRWLRLHYNQLTGAIPRELGALSNLWSLGLDSNQLTGAIPPEIGNLSNLRWLRLDENQLTGAIPPEIGGLSNLKSLGLDGNQLTGAIPLELGNLSNLESLELAGNQLTGAIPPELGNLSDLESLELDGNELTGAIPPELGSLSNLEELFLYDNQLTNPLPQSFINLTALTDFAFGGNAGLCAPTNAAFQNWLQGIPNENLYGAEPLGPNCDGTSPPPPPTPTPDRAALVALYNATNGDNWTDNTNWRTDKPLDEWFGVTTNSDGRVTRLYLQANYLTGTIPTDLGSLHNLTTLYLFDNQLTGAIPTGLGSLSNLTALYLYDNQLTDPLPQSLTNLTALTQFAFGGNAGLCAPTDAAFQAWMLGISNDALHDGVEPLGPNCGSISPPPPPPVGTPALEARLETCGLSDRDPHKGQYQPGDMVRIGARVVNYTFKGNNLLTTPALDYDKLRLYIAFRFFDKNGKRNGELKTEERYIQYDIPWDRPVNKGNTHEFAVRVPAANESSDGEIYLPYGTNSIQCVLFSRITDPPFVDNVVQLQDYTGRSDGIRNGSVIVTDTPEFARRLINSEEIEAENGNSGWIMDASISPPTSEQLATRDLTITGERKAQYQNAPLPRDRSLVGYWDSSLANDLSALSVTVPEERVWVDYTGIEKFIASPDGIYLPYPVEDEQKAYAADGGTDAGELLGHIALSFIPFGNVADPIISSAYALIAHLFQNMDGDNQVPIQDPEVNDHNCTDEVRVVTKLPKDVNHQRKSPIISNDERPMQYQVVIPLHGLQDDELISLNVKPSKDDNALFARNDLLQSGRQAPACERPNGGGEPPPPTPVSCEHTLPDNGVLNGSWTAASSCESENRAADDNKNGAYAEYYTFTLNEQSEVTITLESAQDTYLYLLRGAGKDGAVEDKNDDHTDNDACIATLQSDRDSCIVKTLAAGEWTIEATTYYANKPGDFTLTVSGIR